MATNIEIKRYSGGSWGTLYPKANWNNMDNKPSTFTPSAHTHSQYLEKSGGTMTGNIEYTAHDHHFRLNPNNPTSGIKNYISAGAGYGTTAGLYGVKVLACDQFESNAQQCASGLGQDLAGYSYNLCIVQSNSESDQGHLSFVSHKRGNFGTFRTLADFYDNAGTVTFDVKGSILENGTSLANKYQAKGNYLTSHQDISGKADKASITAGWYKRVYVNSQGIVTNGDQTDTDTNTWRPIKINGTTKIDDTSTALNFIASGLASVNFDSDTNSVVIGATKPSYSFAGSAVTSGANSGSAIAAVTAINAGSGGLEGNTTASGGIPYVEASLSGTELTLTVKYLHHSHTGASVKTTANAAPNSHTHSVTASGSVS